jgi:hypothetical protein
MPHPFIHEWHSRFGSALPAGFHCRRVLADRWLRVHSLPGSKRYAETEAEHAELLRRQNTVATYTLGEDAGCVIVVTRFGNVTQWQSSDEIPLGGTPEHVLSAQEDGDEYQFFALPVVWREGVFNELIVAVANDRTGPVLFANMQQGCIYAPYDGGADLFFPTAAAALTGRSRFKPWLSDRADGL